MIPDPALRFVFVFIVLLLCLLVRRSVLIRSLGTSKPQPVRRARLIASALSHVKMAGGFYHRLVPAFVGLGAPHWDSTARGLLTGITAATSRAHIARAALESIAYQTPELVEAMEADSGERVRELRVDGGATLHNFLMQFQADILGRPIVRPVDVETTALGAAYLAGLATGFWKSVEEIESFWRAERRFEPQLESAVRERLFGEWKSAVARCRSNL